MKKTTKKSAAKVSRKRALKNLDVKPAKGGTVRGGDKAVSKGDKGPTETVHMTYGAIEWAYKN